MPLIETTDLGQRYGERDVLKGANLRINRGEVLAMIGPTGAGKTTLLRLLDLLELPATGTVYFDGIDVTRSSSLRLEARIRMSFVQQKPLLFSMSVFENVACGLRWRHQKDRIVRQKVEDVLELVGMASYANRNAKTLSGGETQRVAIARALATEPEVLFLDEPTANLDPLSTSKAEEILAHVLREQKTAVVMATHDMSQGQRLAGMIGVLMDGEILQVGSPNEIFTSPKSRQVAEFVGVENILAGVVVAKESDLAIISLGPQTAALQAISDYGRGEKVYALVRPEDITLSLSREKSSARNTVEGKIAKITPVGPLVRIELDCGFPLLGLITKTSAEEMNLTIGKAVYASFKATAIRTIKRWS